MQALRVSLNARPLCEVRTVHVGVPQSVTRRQRSSQSASTTARANQPDVEESPAQPTPTGGDEATPRDDDVLPDNLMDSLTQSAEATSLAIQKGINRSVVEILLPEFWDPGSGPVFAEEGDQMRFWKLTKRFADQLIELTGSKNVTVIYPDIGVASYLKNTWADDLNFTITSLVDRKPVTGEEDLVIVAAPDPQGCPAAMKANTTVDPDVPMIMFNPRLASGDVGIGLSVRRMRNQFLGQFITTYSIRPIGDVGTVYRRYPELWRVFIQDEAVPGRYKLVAERPERPAGEALDYIIMEAYGVDEQNEDGSGGPGFLSRVAGTIAGIQRFARSLSN